MVSDYGARAEPTRKGRELRAETKFELPKLRGGALQCCRLPHARQAPHTAGGHGRNRHVGWQEQ